MYSKIINPNTGRKVSVGSQLGREILRKYLLVLIGGASSESSDIMEENDPIMFHIERLHNSELICVTKDGECHRSSIGLVKASELAGLTFESLESGSPLSVNIHNLKKYLIEIENGHYLFKFSSLGHFWFIEVKKSTENILFRVLSLWGSSHGFWEYYQAGPYGKWKMFDEFDDFISLLNELDTHIPAPSTFTGKGHNRETIAIVKQANMGIFGVENPWPGDDAAFGDHEIIYSFPYEAVQITSINKFIYPHPEKERLSLSLVP